MNYLIPIVILVLLGLMVYILTRKKTEESYDISELAKNESWTYTDHKGGLEGIYSLEGPLSKDAIWKLTAYAPSAYRRNAMMNISSEYTEWKATFPFPDFHCYMMPKDPSMKSIPEDKMFQSLVPVWKKMGLPAEQWVLYKSEDADLQSSYLIVANHIPTLTKILNQEVKEQLKNFASLPYARRPSFQFTENQLGVQYRKAITKPLEIKELVSLGTTFYTALTS